MSTAKPLEAAALALAKEGVLMRFTDVLEGCRSAEEAVRQQKFGTHADEIETSMILYIDPQAVSMDRAVADGGVQRPGPLTRDPNRKDAHYSPSGVFGDPTLASREKGRRVVEALISHILGEIDGLAGAPLPPGAPASPLAAVPAP